MNVQQKKITHRNLQYIDNESQMFVRTIQLQYFTIHLEEGSASRMPPHPLTQACDHLINYYHRFIFRKIKLLQYKLMTIKSTNLKNKLRHP